MPPGTQPPARTKFLSIWKFRDQVCVDNDKSIIGVITGFSFTESGQTVRVEWFANADPKSAWFESWRLSHAD